MNLTNLKVSTRLSLGFSFIFILLAGIIVVALMKMANINRQLTSITDINNVETMHLATMRAAVYEQSLITRNIALAENTAAMQQQADRLKQQSGFISLITLSV